LVNNNISTLTTLEHSKGSSIEPVAEVACEMPFEAASLPKTVNFLNAVSEAIICYDSKMRILLANTYACHIFRIPREQINSHQCFALLGHKNSPCEGCPVIQTLKTGKEQKADITTSDGKVLSVKSFPIKDGETGHICGAIEVIKNTAIHVKLYNQHRDVIDFKNRLKRLTQREHEVMELVTLGCPNKIIGVKLGISPKTVEIHRGRIMSKLQVTSIAELVRYITKYEIFSSFLAG
jgi:DNA-binding CsgD family transcriptional regulator